jgi:uncharacterized protein YdcH (DUF465 family)
MSNTPHELSEEFPKDAEKIHRLKLEDAHFARLVTEYHEVNRSVHRAETRIDVVDEAQETALRHKRMVLKDQIAHRLAAA